MPCADFAYGSYNPDHLLNTHWESYCEQFFSDAAKVPKRPSVAFLNIYATYQRRRLPYPPKATIGHAFFEDSDVDGDDSDGSQLVQSRQRRKTFAKRHEHKPSTITKRSSGERDGEFAGRAPPVSLQASRYDQSFLLDASPDSEGRPQRFSSSRSMTDISSGSDRSTPRLIGSSTFPCPDDEEHSIGFPGPQPLDRGTPSPKPWISRSDIVSSYTQDTDRQGIQFLQPSTFPSLPDDPLYSTKISFPFNQYLTADIPPGASVELERHHSAWTLGIYQPNSCLPLVRLPIHRPPKSLRRRSTRTMSRVALVCARPSDPVKVTVTGCTDEPSQVPIYQLDNAILTSQVFELCKDMGHRTCLSIHDDGVPGRHNCCHAEKQAVAYLHAKHPGLSKATIHLSDDPCTDCSKFLRKYQDTYGMEIDIKVYGVTWHNESCSAASIAAL